MRTLTLLLAAVAFVAAAEESIPEIARRLPPTNGIEIPPEIQEGLEKRLDAWEDRLVELEGSPEEADIAVLVKAVRFALRFGEFYNEKELPHAGEMLDLADQRFAKWKDDDLSLNEKKGLSVRGYRSSIDESFQPFGLEIPENLDLSEPVPLLVWLHGRGDKITDLHFIRRC